MSRLSRLSICLLSLILLKSSSIANPGHLVAKPSIVERHQWGSQPDGLGDGLLHQPKSIAIHHAGVAWKQGDDPLKKIKNLQSWGQREKGWPDVPYHYLISPDGRILEGRDWRYRPESNTDYDLDGVLNVQLWGDFDRQSVTLEQLQALTQTVAWLCQEHGISVSFVRGHGDAAPGQTSCPGKDLKRYLDKSHLYGWINQSLIGHLPRVKLEAPLPDSTPTAP